MTVSFRAAETGFVHVCGHRGHCLGAPENTIAAFRAAARLGGTSCEIDTVLTRDRRIVVMHDLLVDRTTDGTGAVKDLTAADIARLDAGSWFDPAFAGERVPTLRQTLAVARELDLVLEVEIKEKRDVGAYLAALAEDLADPEDRSRVMAISFDHVSLAAAKAAVPGLRTGGIVHERLGDPVAVARAAGLDQLCIDLGVFDADHAARLHDAGISVRCHAYSPDVMAKAAAAGLDWHAVMTDALRRGLIDTLSGDDVGWLRRAVDAAPGPRAEAVAAPAG